MCTSIIIKQKDMYFGRNLDLECSFGEKVVITPRDYPFTFHNKESISHHYAMIGMATVVDNYPLYAEAMNEKGLAMAGLNFPGNAHYFEWNENKNNITPFEFIPYLLSQYATIQEVKEVLKTIQLLDVPFKKEMPLAPLHWMITDGKESIIVESMQDGLHVYEDKYGVLTNNPPYEYHVWNVQNYLHMTPMYPENKMSKHVDINPYGNGFGSIGLPGDCSPASRFVRAFYVKDNSIFTDDEEENITQFFHILDAVSMVKGSVLTPQGKVDYTTYSCGMNLSKGWYYYKTYENNQLTCIKMKERDLGTKKLYTYELQKKQQVAIQ